MQQSGQSASIQCRNRTAELFCMNFFPPCQNATNYAIYPCHDNCLLYQEVCSSHMEQSLCPLDGPAYNATSPGKGTHRRSNNALWSCFTSDGTIKPLFFLRCINSRSRCLASHFECGTNAFHPECMNVQIPSNSHIVHLQRRIPGPVLRPLHDVRTVPPLTNAQSDVLARPRLHSAETP